MIKNFLIVTVALFTAVSTAFAHSTAYGPVLGVSAGEVSVTYNVGHSSGEGGHDDHDHGDEGHEHGGHDHNGWDFQFRYGVTDRLELYAANSAPGTSADWVFGARYQILPEWLTASLNAGFSNQAGTYWEEHGHGHHAHYHDHSSNLLVFSVIPGAALFWESESGIELGFGTSLGVDLNYPKDAHGLSDETEIRATLNFGFELGYHITGDIVVTLGSEFHIDGIAGGNGTHFDYEPEIGVEFIVGNLTLGASLGPDFHAVNSKGEESVGLRGGISVAIGF